ncbi:MAG TPA: histidine phosphatase family protein [Ideonella sp.]|nr:histidine phosphatase family protein [Ideonella sp.]
MILWLVRHLRTVVSEGVCYGRTDVETHGDPAHEAAELIARVRRDAPAALFSSPLKRCRLLADCIGPAVFDERLRELDFGKWEMQAWGAIERDELDAWRAQLEHWRVPGGESLGELAARVAAFLADLRAAAPDSACLVTHAGVIRVVACLLWRQDLARALDFSVPLGSALRVEWRGDSARLLERRRFGSTRLPPWLAG